VRKVGADLGATRPALLRVGPYDGFVQHATITSAGWSYVPYDRMYRGLPVVGVPAVDAAGRGQPLRLLQRGLQQSPGRLGRGERAGAARRAAVLRAAELVATDCTHEARK
jgi:hypothetical protein